MVVGVAMLALLVTALLPGLGRGGEYVSARPRRRVGVLLGPGPDRCSWAVWLGGGLSER